MERPNGSGVKAAAPLKRLLVVDDEEDLLYMVALAAESTGQFVVEKAREGEGFIKAMSFHPDVAVLDALMTKMDGFELCRRLRANPKTRHLPILVLSAGEPARCQVQALDAGADGFMRKPYDQDELIRVLLALCRKAKGKSSNGGASGIRTRE